MDQNGKLVSVKKQILDPFASENGQKWHFLCLEKWLKTMVYSVFIPNLKKRKNHRWNVCNQSCLNFVFNLRHFEKSYNNILDFLLLIFLDFFFGDNFRPKIMFF